MIAHDYAQLGEVRLHYAHAGPEDGPLVLLLHGYPEFSYSWRHQLPALGNAGFRAIAPDTRGYNLSDHPRGDRAYRIETLVEDVRQLIEHFGRKQAAIVGHDWGGLIAWWFAIHHPSWVERLTVMNCPHPDHQLAMMASLRQLKKSRYMLFFQVPLFAEPRMRKNDFQMLRKLLRRDPVRRDAFSEDDIERYVEAFKRGDAVRTSMAYYRALLRRNPFALAKKIRAIDLPTQVIWGAQDRHLGIEYAEPPARWVWDLKMDYIPDASHWVQVDAPEQVNELLLDFLPRPD